MLDLPLHCQGARELRRPPLVGLCLPVSKSFMLSLYLHGLLAQERTLSRLLARSRVPARLIFDLDSTVLGWP